MGAPVRLDRGRELHGGPRSDGAPVASPVACAGKTDAARGGICFCRKLKVDTPRKTRAVRLQRDPRWGGEKQFRLGRSNKD